MTTSPSTPSPAPGSSDGHYKKFLSERARKDTTLRPLLVKTPESVFRAGDDDSAQISLDNLGAREGLGGRGNERQRQTVANHARQEAVLHSIGRLFDAGSIEDGNGIGGNSIDR
jgi:hypothetical protein